MSRDELIAAILSQLEALPSNPIAPENRGLAGLRTTEWIDRGKIFRIVVDARPLILMHPLDAAVMRAIYAELPLTWSLAQIDQDVADLCEQMFAELEARGAL